MKNPAGGEPGGVLKDFAKLYFDSVQARPVALAAAQVCTDFAVSVFAV